MKNMCLTILFSLLLFFSFSVASNTTDVTVSGAAYFKCKFRSTYMAKHGYQFIEEVLHKRILKTNLFAANDAEVIIKNKDNATLGAGKTDEKGHFSISVPEDQSYKVIVKFHEQEFEKTVSYPETEDITVNLGYFSTEKVGSWIDARLGVSVIRNPATLVRIKKTDNGYGHE